jgi:opacity protein-like surface antigen
MCGGQQLLGVAPFVDANQLLFHRLGAEGEARFLHWRGPGAGLTESTYLAGPRFALISFKHSIGLSGKFLVGSANIHVPNDAAGNGTHFAYAPGAVAEFKVSRRLTARVDYEYQIWRNFIGNGGLTPNGFSFGLSYMILRQR